MKPRPLGARVAIGLAWIGHGSAAVGLLAALATLIAWLLGGIAA